MRCIFITHPFTKYLRKYVLFIFTRMISILFQHSVANFQTLTIYIALGEFFLLVLLMGYGALLCFELVWLKYWHLKRSGLWNIPWTMSADFRVNWTIFTVFVNYWFWNLQIISTEVIYFKSYVKTGCSCLCVEWCGLCKLSPNLPQ